MTVRLLITTAALLGLAGPAFADCKQEIQSLNAAVTEAETGASTTDTGMPATQHQEQVLKGQPVEPSGGGATGQADVPASPHQRQALAPNADGQQEPAAMIAEAGDMAAAGDEDGCMQKVSEIKSMLGID